MAGLAKVMRCFSSLHHTQRGDDLEAGRGLLADEMELAAAKMPDGRARIPNELLAMIFSHVEDRKDKQSLPYVCRTWRDVYYDPVVFNQLSGAHALRYVAYESLFTPRIAALLRAQSISPNAVAFAPIARALRQVQDVSLFEMAQATCTYKKAILQQERRPRELAALSRFNDRYTQIESARFAACTHLFFTAGKWSTIPVSVAWFMMQASVTSLRHAMGISPFLIAASVIFVGPLIATGLSACGAGLAFGIDYVAARVGHAAELFEPVADTSLPKLPAFYDDIEAACRNMWEAA